MSSAILAIKHQLETASTFSAVFGRLVGSDPATQLRHLKKAYRGLVKLTHPDQVAPAERALASQVFTRLVATYESAKKAVETGRYEQAGPTGVASSAKATATVVVESPKDRYTLEADIWAEGDFSNLHRGVTKDGTAVYVKIASDLPHNAFLAKEASFYRSLLGNDAAAGLRKYLPELLDTFVVTERPGEQYRVNVFRDRPRFISLTKIHEAYPRGLDPRDAAWIWRRLIAQALAGSVLGVVHGAIVPDHVLVNPDTHEPLHIGWVHSVERPQERQARLTTVIDRWRDWYPKEVFAREIPTLQTDLYMVGKTMIYLAGGDVATNRFPRHYPEVMKDTVRALIASDARDRPQDGPALLRTYTDGVRRLWGTTFRPLTVPK